MSYPQTITLAPTPVGIPPNSRAAQAGAQEAIARYLSMLKGWAQTRYAVVGDGDGNVAVPDRPMFVYVRLGDADGEVAEARNLPMLAPAEGDTVLVRRERPGALGPWQILEWCGAGTPPINLCDDGTFELLCRSQLQIYSFASSVTVGGSSIAVKGHYAYIAQRYQTTPITLLPFGNSQLITVDLSNPDAPAVVDTLDMGVALTNTNIGWYGDTLWVTGSVYDAGIPLIKDRARSLYSFDLSNPAAPSAVASASTRLAWSWSVYVDGTTPYLVGQNWSTSNTFDDLVITDAASLTEVGHLSGSYNISDIWRFPTFAGATGFVQLASGDLRAFDLTTPASPATLFDTSTVNVNLATLDADHIYAASNTDQQRVNVTTPASPGYAVLSAPIAPQNYGFYLDSTNLVSVSGYQAEWDNVASPLVPVDESNQTGFYVTDDSVGGKIGAADKDGSIVYLCGVGINQFMDSDGNEIDYDPDLDGYYLTVFTFAPM